MTQGLNWKEQNENILTKNDLPIGDERQKDTMPLDIINLNSPPVVGINCDNGKAMGKEQLHRKSLEKSTKSDNTELKKKTMTKWKSNFEINKELEYKQLLW